MFCNKNYNCYCGCQCDPCRCERRPRPQPCPGPGPRTIPFRSSYIEAIGTTQTVANGANFVFDTTPEALDIAGNDIVLSDDGTVFTINRVGLYYVDWTVNLGSGVNPVIVCLLENDEVTSGASNRAQTGNYSSSALINVTRADLPFTLSLHNFGGELTAEEQTGVINTAVSIKIFRFADGPTVLNQIR